eukprot:CAMPEP_0184664830 /NCGR_PEP_ID=MMETSP0308-20130426/54549_1 /TAXON_ID=38269 /ORGANISM="Gloeochaete witrockiana, Strain SAG 46.84" /LENGTH=76 /DNA_ID=CAMNT_0027108453 /DNA_START=48 /DNA_END=278 /DNA_ORIENTATION=+
MAALFSSSKCLVSDCSSTRDRFNAATSSGERTKRLNIVNSSAARLSSPLVISHRSTACSAALFAMVASLSASLRIS